MRQKFLTDFDSFDDYPSGLLRISSDSNLFYAVIDGNKYIVREMLEGFDYKVTELIYNKNYYDVLKNELVFSCECVKSLIDGKTTYKTENIKLIKLSEILNLKGDSVSNFDKEDIENLIGYKEEKSKNPRKNYF